MFQYFPTNYVWSLSVAIAMESGARIGEVDEICRPLIDVSRQGDDAGTAAFFTAWCAMADKLVALADEDLAAHRPLSAGTKRLRAALYYLVAERMHRHADPARHRAYSSALRAFAQGTAEAARPGTRPGTRIVVPYGDAEIAGLFIPAQGVSGPAPCMLHVNGLDSTKELLYFAGLAQAMACRGVASFIVDQPGTGEALRHHNLPATPHSERWATPLLEHLAARPDVDPGRIGIVGVSLGGYYAPRAMAFEPRFALGAVWGANHDWGEVQHKRLAREGDRPVPYYWDHVRWVFGAPSMDTFMRTAAALTLEGILDRIHAPFLVTHGENDRQIPVATARRTYEGLVNSPHRTLKLFTPREGGVEHVSLDNMSFGADYIADWVSEAFQAMRDGAKVSGP